MSVPTVERLEFQHFGHVESPLQPEKKYNHFVTEEQTVGGVKALFRARCASMKFPNEV